MQIVRPYRVGCAGVLALLVGTLAGAQASKARVRSYSRLMLIFARRSRNEWTLSPAKKMASPSCRGRGRSARSKGYPVRPSKPRRAAIVGWQHRFEIGSATKVLTAMLLADMVRKGEVATDA